MSDLTTIIIPCYNAATTLQEAYDSLPSQDAKNPVPLEIILVDDCSSDDTVALIKKIAASDKRVKTIFGPTNEGVSRSRNKALEAAKGTFILFMDADDRMTENGLSKLLSHMSDDVDFVRGKHLLWNAQSGATSENIGDENNFVELIAVPPASVPQLTAIYSSWNALFRRALIKENGLAFDTNLKLGEDREFNLRYLLKCRKVSLVNAYTYLWRKNAESGQQATQLLVRDPTEVFASIHALVEQIDSEGLADWGRHRDYMSTALLVELTNFLASFSRQMNQGKFPDTARAQLIETVRRLDKQSIIHPVSGAKGYAKPFADLYKIVEGYLGTRIGDDFFKIFFKRLGEIRLALNAPNLEAIDPAEFQARQRILEAVSNLTRNRRGSDALLHEVDMIRQANIFDVGHYCASYPDVAASDMDPLVHFVTYGASELRNPNSWFDTSQYFSENPELVLTGANPLAHYINHTVLPLNWVF